MSNDTITTAKTKITQALRENYGVKSKDYTRAMRQARGYLPRKLQKEARYLDEAQADLQHPLKRRNVDLGRVDKARRQIMEHAIKSDPAADRSKALFGWASELVIRLLLAGAVLYFVGRWVGAF